LLDFETAARVFVCVAIASYSKKPDALWRCYINIYLSWMHWHVPLSCILEIYLKIVKNPVQAGGDDWENDAVDVADPQAAGVVGAAGPVPVPAGPGGVVAEGVQ